MNDNHETREEYRKKMEQRIHDKVAQDLKQNHESKMSKFKLPKFKSSNNNPRRTSSNMNPNTPEVHHYRTPRWVKNINLGTSYFWYYSVVATNTIRLIRLLIIFWQWRW